MFFSISKKLDQTFPNHLEKNNFYIDYDNGWSCIDNILYKGITPHGFLEINHISEVAQYRNSAGTFCILNFNDNQIEIITGNKQKFPLFIEEDRVSNLYKNDNVVDGKVIITDKINVIPSKDIEHTELNLTDDEIIDLLDKKIDEKIKNFNAGKIKVYPTGVDSLLLISYLLKNNIAFELVPGEHADMDHFLCHHRTYLQQTFWAYQTVQHYKEKSVLLTGGHGDEMLLRDPLQSFLILKHHKIDLVDLCRKNDYYMSKHILKPSCLQTYEQYKDYEFNDLKSLKTFLLNVFRTDYQHWHLGNTFFFSPLDDIDLLDTILNLSHEAMLGQLLEASVSKELIRRNRPGLLNLISPSKNFDYYINLAEVFDGKVKLEDIQ